MKKFLKILSLIFASFLIIILAFLFYLSQKPAVPKNYFDTNLGAIPLEKIFSKLGKYETAKEKFTFWGGKESEYIVYFPEELKNSSKKYPIILFANGTGVPAKKYEDVVKHMASWGFIAIGNNQDHSWFGSDISKMLYFMELKNTKNEEKNPFFGKIDLEKIGISGHSQGGVATINAINNFQNSEKIRSAYSISPASLELAKNIGWNYDVSKIQIPIFYSAGTGDSDGKFVSPLPSLEENFAKTESGKPTFLGRMVGVEHGDMLYKGNGVMVAWFLWTLTDDAEAKKIFAGDDAEIFKNPDWSDIKRKNIE